VKVGVAGLGLVGGSLLKALAARGTEVAGHDADPAVRSAAAGEGFEVCDDVRALAERSELVLVAVPPDVTAGVVAAALSAGGVVADTASVKAPVLDGVRALVTPGDLARFVPGHPLSGAERSGWAAARADIAEGAAWAVCPPAPGAGVEALCVLGAAVDALDGRVVACTAPDHDAAVARTSHVPHVAAQALGRILGNGERGLRAALAGPAWRDMTRVARSDAGLWVEILSLNRAGALAALGELEEELRWYAAALEAGDREGLESSWRQTADDLAATPGPREWADAPPAEPAWEAPLAHGRTGRAVRRLRLEPGEEGQVLRYEVER
jgi:prephenate dehydrogenase